MTSGIVDVLRDLSIAFHRGGFRWYLFGAQAVGLFGRPRTTVDVDVTVEIDDASSLVRVLSEAGFGSRVDAAESFLAESFVLPVVHRSTGLPVDVVVAGSGLERAFLDRAVSIDVGGVPVPTISPSDLIVAKILAGRPKDLDDVVGVLKAQGASVAVTTVREMLAEIEDALDLHGLADQLTACVERAKA